MAHFRRRRPRLKSSGHRGETFMRKRLGMKPIRLPYQWWSDSRIERDLVWPNWYNWTAHGPAWHDRLYHIRPHRTRTRRCEQAILMGADPDDMVWPIPYKPRVYYW